MASVAVVHDDLGLGGGGERVCVAVLAALQDAHEVTLYTRTPVDPAEANRYYDADVAFGEEVRAQSLCDLGAGPRLFAGAADALARATGTELNVLRTAVLERAVRARAGDHDVVVSTAGPFTFGRRAVLYCHKYSELDAMHAAADAGPLARFYGNVIHDAVSGFDPESVARDRHLANSEWTARRGRRIYGVDPEVVYPPVDVAAFEGGRPWADREDGFVCVGRVEPAKRTHVAVDVVGRLRERGHDVHLHVVGPTQDPAYRERIVERAGDLDFVTFEGRVPRSELVDLVGDHRYGIHARRPEHFGIAVAEMVAAGAVPFVPDVGGQREVVGEDARLCYDSPDAAVELIEAVLDSPGRQAAIRRSLPDAREKFGRERFAREVRAVVAEELGRTRVTQAPRSG